MKRRWFVLTAILAMAAVTVFLTNQVTQAQRPDRGGMRGGGERRGGGGMRAFNPTSIIDTSWTDLTFSVKVDDETLIKARPVYQKHRDNLQKTLKEARESGDREGLREAFGKIGSGFKADLKSVLTEDQIAQLEELAQKRSQQMMGRGGGRGGGGGRGR